MGGIPCMWIGLNKAQASNRTCLCHSDFKLNHKGYVCSGEHSQGSVPPPVEEGNFASHWCSGVLQTQNKAGLQEASLKLCMHMLSCLSQPGVCQPLRRDWSRENWADHQKSLTGCRVDHAEGQSTIANLTPVVSTPRSNSAAELTSSQSARPPVVQQLVLH